ncbi:MAG: helix-turn-helix transcriptional regulator [Clostridia bacterium]|jgi:transcriptional regulator with XRE-family HTH domain|nr:helix-turn-helix transcriptional regulator [Clostridia bacterium]
MSFGINLKKIRQDNNLTQEELAKKINTSRSNIANYENDKNMPSVDILEKLSKELHCSIDYLIGLTSYKNPKKDLEKKLYELDLTEKEFDTVINLLTNDNKINFLFEFQKNKDPQIKKITLAYKTCLSICWDYSIEALSDISNYEHIKTIHDSPKMKKALDVINSLDKRNIIHNYNSQQIDDVFNEAMIGMSKKDYENLTETQKKQIRDFALFVKNQNEEKK